MPTTTIRFDLKMALQDQSLQPAGDRIRELRNKRGLSLENFAYETKARFGKSGLTYSAIGQIERGESQPKIASIEIIADVLGVAPETFVEYRLAKLRKLLDERGLDEGGVGFDQAAENLAVLEAATNAIPGLIGSEIERLVGGAENDLLAAAETKIENAEPGKRKTVPPARST